MCSMMGTLPTGTRGLGRWAVRGRRRVPNPPAITTAFTSRSPGERKGIPTRHRFYRSIAEMPESRNLPGAARAPDPGVARTQDEEQGHAGQESSEVREPGCSPPSGLSAWTRGRPGRQTGQELDQEPETEDQHRRDAHHPYEKAEDNESQHVCPGKEQQVCAE